MTSSKTFSEKIDQLKEEVSRLPDITDRANIEQTAVRLEGLHYAPPLFMPVSDFLRLTTKSLLEEIDKILAMPDQEACQLVSDDSKKCEDLCLQHISVLVYHYKQLVLLRQEDPDTWDEIDEVYVHD